MTQPASAHEDRPGGSATLAAPQGRVLDRLRDSGRRLSAANDDAGILSALCAWPRELDVAAGCLAYVQHDDDGDTPQIVVAATWTDAQGPTGNPPRNLDLADHPALQSLLDRRTDQAVIVNADSDAAAADVGRLLFGEPDVATLVLIPFERAGKLLGFGALGWRASRAIPDAEADYYTGLIGLGSPVLANRRLLDSLEAVVETRAAEAAVFNALADNAADGIVMCDLDGRITYTNHAFRELIAYRNAAEPLHGQMLWRFWPSSDEVAFREHWLLPAHEAARGAELRLRRWDDHGLDANVTMYPVRDARERTAHIAATFQDITERKQAERERDRLQREATAAQQSAIRELSTPIIPLVDRIIVMPIVGSVNTLRARDILRALLSGIHEHRARVVILDVTGVAIIDTGVANHLTKAVKAARLKGARTIVTGISDAAAETIVEMGGDWTGVETLSDLKTGLLAALRSVGLHLRRRTS